MKNSEINHSAKFIRQRKMFMSLPVIVFPFICLFFWALGGGKSAALAASAKKENAGINLSLPQADLSKVGEMTKLAYYQKADADSIKQQKRLAMDGLLNPYDRDSGMAVSEDVAHFDGFSHYASPAGKRRSDPNEEKVYRKISELNNALGSGSSIGRRMPEQPFRAGGTPAVSSAEVNKLESMMRAMKSGGGEADPELEQLNGMLDKISEIQNPDLVREKLKRSSAEHKGQVFPIGSRLPRQQGSLLSSAANDTADKPGNGFFSMSEQDITAATKISISAVVHGTQIISTGTNIKFRLLSDVFVGGSCIPKNSFVTGIAALSGERLNVTVSSLRYRDAIFPVDLTVYDMDGIAGIRVPGTAGADVARQSVNQTAGGIGLSALDPSLGVQAANAGLELSKKLLNKKVKQVKVTITADYKVLLVDGNQK